MKDWKQRENKRERSNMKYNNNIAANTFVPITQIDDVVEI